MVMFFGGIAEVFFLVIIVIVLVAGLELYDYFRYVRE
jgi:hypothetical protein